LNDSALFVLLKNEEKEFINTLANGIVIYGYLEVK